MRIDIDGRMGLRKGVPNLLEVLRRTDVRASFFTVMGGESSIIDVLRYRGGPEPSWDDITLPKTEVLRTLFFPKDFVTENAGILEKILAEGHTLGPHGWKHRAWTRCLDKLDVDEQFKMMIAKYRRLFRKKPRSFAGPAFKTNLRVLECLDKHGFLCAGDVQDGGAFHPVVGGKRFKHVQVPVTLRAHNTDPLIEWFSGQGLSDDAVVKKIAGMVVEREKRGALSVFYCHDFFEGIYKPHLVERVLKEVKGRGAEFATMEEIAKKCRTWKEVVL